MTPPLPKEQLWKPHREWPRQSHDLNAYAAFTCVALQMDVQIAARYRGCLHGRLPVDCTYFKGDVLVAIGGYSQAGSVHVFEPLEGLKVRPVSC